MTGFECVVCESCGRSLLPSVLDVHHIKGRNIPDFNNIKNLIGLCRDPCHDAAGVSQAFNATLEVIAADLPERLKCYELSQIMISESM